MPMPVAVIGCGYWGRNLVRNFAELGALAAICDPDQATASQLSARYGAPVAALEPMLRDPAIAGVAIAAPAAARGACDGGAGSRQACLCREAAGFDGAGGRA